MSKKNCAFPEAVGIQVMTLEIQLEKGESLLTFHVQHSHSAQSYTPSAHVAR